MSADIDARNGQEWTAAMLAAYGGHLRIVEYLAHKGCDLKTSESKQYSVIIVSPANSWIMLSE